jgi:mannitol-specific phosphotransferase system IIBC component
MQHPLVDSGVKSGTAGGTLLTLWINIQQEDLLKTALLAAIGAAVSFSVSLLLKWLVKRLRR